MKTILLFITALALFAVQANADWLSDKYAAAKEAGVENLTNDVVMVSGTCYPIGTPIATSLCQARTLTDSAWIIATGGGFSGFEITGADDCIATFIGSDASYCIMSGTTVGIGCTFENDQFDHCQMVASTLTSSTISGNISGDSSSFVSCDLIGSTIGEINNCTFTDCNLTNANLSGKPYFTGATLNNQSSITGANLSSLNLTGLDLPKFNLAGCDLSNCKGITQSQLTAAGYSAALIRGWNTLAP